MATPLKISEAASIAMHALILLSENEDDPVSNASIAQAFNVSANHSSKVMQRLLKEGFVTAVRGPSGGYTLARSPESVTLLEIYQAIDGKPSSSGCLFGRGVHCSLKTCLFHSLLSETDRLIEKHLGSVTLQSFKKRNIELEVE